MLLKHFRQEMARYANVTHSHLGSWTAGGSQEHFPQSLRTPPGIQRIRAGSHIGDAPLIPLYFVSSKSFCCFAPPTPKAENPEIFSAGLFFRKHFVSVKHSASGHGFLFFSIFPPPSFYTWKKRNGKALFTETLSQIESVINFSVRKIFQV